MSSLIPKIKLGQDTKSGNKFDLSSMTHTTSEIGFVHPTFSKELVPKSKVRIGTRTGVRLSPLFVPTMGQIDVRHYHCFVPYSTLWTQFDAFITGTNYTLPSGSTVLPNRVPYTRVNDLLWGVFGFNSAIDDPRIEQMRYELESAVYFWPAHDNQWQIVGEDELQAFLDDNSHSVEDFLEASRLKYISKAMYDPSTEQTYSIRYRSNAWELYTVGGKVESIPQPFACDFSEVFTLGSQKICICYNWTGSLKRLRTIFLGLGYSFNPFDTESVNVFKLLAYYKAYWTLFGVNRTYNFFNTWCYKFIKYSSEHSMTQFSNLVATDAYVQFVRFMCDELCNCTYTMPVDYFSSADITTQRGGLGQDITITSPAVFTDGRSVLGATQAWNSGNTSNNNPVSTTAGNLLPSMGEMYPLAQKIAMRLMRFVNKNSVLGKQISEILRARYGVTDIHNTTHESVIRVGASSCPVQISAVYNNSDSGDLPLGSYAGLGVGSHRSKMFTFSTNEFGCLITLTAVVPKMGYFQGMLRENSDGVNGRFDFYTPEFDAIGWQTVRNNELVADRQHMDVIGSEPVGTNLGVWGYQPFYTHMKVGFNRCLADISLPRFRESMLPYTLDRYFPDIRQGYDDPSPTINPLPVNDPLSFRSGTQGNANRIFTDVNPTEDHVIMQIFFDVKMSSPMKSISTSYDTWDEESEKTVEVSHE